MGPCNGLNLYCFFGLAPLHVALSAVETKAVRDAVALDQLKRGFVVETPLNATGSSK
jgi:hypothetical protein